MQTRVKEQYSWLYLFTFGIIRVSGHDDMVDAVLCKCVYHVHRYFCSTYSCLARAAAANHLSDPLIAVLDLTRKGRTNIFNENWRKSYCNEVTISTISASTG